MRAELLAASSALRKSLVLCLALAGLLAWAGCGAKVAPGDSTGTLPEGGFISQGDQDGGSADGEPDSPASAAYPAPHPALPSVQNLGGPLLTHPNFVPVFFPGDALQQQIEDFISKLATSSYWTGNLAEYGVGAATISAPVNFATNPFTNPVDDSAIASWVSGEIENGGLPAYASGDLYVLFMPDGTGVTLQGAASCTGFGGYHNETSLTTGDGVPYAVLPRCAMYGGLTGIDVITGAASHELIEGTTDPFPQSEPAYVQVDPKDIGWEILLGGGEIADMCAQNYDAFFVDTALGSTVQRTWSNKAAAASHDPCIPPPSGSVYFNAAPAMPDKIPLNLGQVVDVTGVKIDVGKSVTIPVDLFSDADMASWAVSAQDGSFLQGGAPQLSFKFDKSSGKNGTTLQLTITVLSEGQDGIETFAISSSTDQNINLWVGLVSSL